MIKKNKIYNKIYSEKTYNKLLYTGLIGLLFKYQHKKISPKKVCNKEKILEIGPGYEPHIKYVKNLNFKKYYCLETNRSRKIKKYYKHNYPQIIFKSYNGKNIKFKENYFDRIILSHTLEHINNFETFLEKIFKLIKKNGVISIASPCDNGLLWRMGSMFLKYTYHKFVTKISSVDLDYHSQADHVNTIFQIISVLKKKYIITDELYLPFRIKIPDFNLIHICHIKK